MNIFFSTMFAKATHKVRSLSFKNLSFFQIVIANVYVGSVIQFLHWLPFDKCQLCPLFENKKSDLLPFLTLAKSSAAFVHLVSIIKDVHQPVDPLFSSWMKTHMGDRNSLVCCQIWYMGSSSWINFTVKNQSENLACKAIKRIRFLHTKKRLITIRNVCLQCISYILILSVFFVTPALICMIHISGLTQSPTKLFR